MTFLRKYLSLDYLKAHVALVGGALTWYLASPYSTESSHKYVAAALAVLTALGVGAADNTSEDAVLDDVAEHVFPEDSNKRSSHSDSAATTPVAE